MDKLICISVFENEETSDIQNCVIPSELLCELGGRLGSYIQLSFEDRNCFNMKNDLNLDVNCQILCRAVPISDSITKSFYQVICNNCVSITDRLGSITGNFYLSSKNVNILQPKTLLKITLNVIVHSVEDVLNYRENKFGFKESLSELLRLYGVIEKATIKFHSNPFAKLYGISQVIVNECDLHTGEVGKFSSNTEILINEVESEDKRRLMVRSSVPLGGLDQVLDNLKRLLKEPWEFRDAFSKAGAMYPSGVLLVGPPGCGKTSLIRQLCIETETCLVATASAELISTYEGETEANFAKVASQAQSLSKEGPCLFFIDEIDSLCRPRTKESSFVELQLTAQILSTIDSCQDYPGLTLMAATNRPYDLDSAIRRSGRFEIEILLNVPNESERHSILQVHCHDFVEKNHPGLLQVANATPGFVGADLKSLVDQTKAVVKTGHNKKPVEDEIISSMLYQSGTMTPSIHKTLDFITAKPTPMPVGGLKDVQEQLDQIFTHHTKLSWAYKKLKLKPPRGVLLYGPQGCGKTRLVASVAAKRGCTFISANASHLLSSYVGDSEKRIAALFYAARLAQPTILFIDEIDGIFGRRDTGSSGMQVNLLNELLQAMDGADVAAASLQGSQYLGNTTRNIQDGVLVCGATNHPESLDPALLRPGRFDRLVYVPLPDKTARLEILKLKTSKLNIPDEKVLEEFASKTEGWTGAELENLIRKATISSIRGGINFKNPILAALAESELQAAFETSSPAVTEAEVERYKNFGKKL